MFKFVYKVRLLTVDTLAVKHYVLGEHACMHVCCTKARCAASVTGDHPVTEPGAAAWQVFAGGVVEAVHGMMPAPSPLVATHALCFVLCSAQDV